MSRTDVRPKLLIVDDEPTNLQVLRHILQDEYRLVFARDGHKAISLAKEQQPDLILLDIMMPDLDGLSVCRLLKSEHSTRSIPVIFVTALSDVDDEAIGFEAGGVDYITKPVSAAVVKARVKTHLNLVHLDEIRETRLAIVQRLGRASEYKDNETGMHVIRMSHYSRVIARAAGFNEHDADDLLNAAPMHDVGKIGIPDSIIRKPGKLDADEWREMQRHAEIGAEIIGQDDSSLLQMARRIALYHHEKWDGSGYPEGLKGEAIPIEARIVAIADVFDALTSVRPYKKAWTVDDAVNLIVSESGKHFDPTLVDVFVQEIPAILEIKARWVETE
ncbi:MULTISPECIES: response regulator [Nitrincola]|uniref:Cyclic di-GMP phosphodiesterase response regulator RpfG n=1 Tax=Nitrincola nitratireducens TaxID=1229521 RepID=W9UV91_9GAMM|nr:MULTISPECIES: HD domain-containing phosphohydrolase [Nitrincola]EXJ10989.1 Cyclic di-GMP phosphodiesterase response regulator RpfG [Nitrincola nitratireducens]